MRSSWSVKIHGIGLKSCSRVWNIQHLSFGYSLIWKWNYTHLKVDTLVCSKSHDPHDSLHQNIDHDFSNFGLHNMFVNQINKVLKLAWNWYKNYLLKEHILPISAWHKEYFFKIIYSPIRKRIPISLSNVKAFAFLCQAWLLLHRQSHLLYMWTGEEENIMNYPIQCFSIIHFYPRTQPV